MRTIKLTIAYDGTDYVGWQRQPNGVSVQGRLEAAIEKMTGAHRAVVGAGRTDAGVHALGQVAHCIVPKSIPLAAFVAGLTSLLPPDIAVLAAAEAPEGFHARKDAKGKVYRYRLLEGVRRAPLLQHRCWQIPEMLDLAAMRRAAECLVGRHDFASFRAAGCGSRDAVRRIDRLEVVRAPCHADPLWGDQSGRLIDIECEGDGFVRHMIRNIVGTLVDVGRGDLSWGAMQGILAAKERTQAGRCAPACGLYLRSVIS